MIYYVHFFLQCIVIEDALAGVKAAQALAGNLLICSILKLFHTVWHVEQVVTCQGSL